jgi:predicted adenine nucleotide alpha hydrolase (AANH) superfamily ATPase
MSKEPIMVHACCATCAGYAIQKLSENYQPIIYFYNPNIQPEDEYFKRRNELKLYTTKLNIPFYEDKPDFQGWQMSVKGFENEPEKGKRCGICFHYRLDKAAKFALSLNINLFTTTLTISPHKNSLEIIRIGKEIASLNNKLVFLDENFKKKDGFKKTMAIALTEGFYRQNYCGCQYSRRGLPEENIVE